MKAEIVQAKCQHMQEYGETYSVIAVTDDKGTWLLRVPMWQYDPYTGNVLSMLQKVVDAINKGNS